MTERSHCLSDLPKDLSARAFYAGEEAAWPQNDALAVIEWATRNGCAVCGVEIWLPGASGPEIPSPFMYNWIMRNQDKEELWQVYLQRSNQEAANYVQDFQWDDRDLYYRSREPLFNLDIYSRVRD